MRENERPGRKTRLWKPVSGTPGHRLIWVLKLLIARDLGGAPRLDHTPGQTSPL